jgi:hypothetical protein
MNYWSYLEMGLVLLCLGTLVFCFARISLLVLKVFALSLKFQNRLGVVDPTAYKSLSPFIIHPFWVKNYIVKKDVDADPELLELERKINAPVKYGLLTVLLMFGGFIDAGTIMFIFDAFLKNLNRHG